MAATPHPAQNPPPPNRKNFGAVIAVASGKGGVGKSTVAVNLACALAQNGYRVGLLDADIYGPSQHIMLGLKENAPEMTPEKRIIPLQQYGIKTISFGFFIKPEDAVVWRGPMISRMFQQFVDDVEWGDLDYLVVDLPPGTGDIQLTLSQFLQVTGTVVVTTPQDVALADAIKGINMFRKVNIEILGVVENMSFFCCPQCGHETSIFSKGGGRRKAEELKVEVLEELPLEEATREAGDVGKPIVVRDPQSAQAKRFLNLATKVHKRSEEVKKKMPSISFTPAKPEGSQFSV